MNPTDFDLRGIQPTKAQKSSARVSPSLSAATPTAAAALATISHDAALKVNYSSESEMEEAEESAFDVPVPTESYDSAPTYLPTLKKGKMTLDHVLVIVQFLLKTPYKERSFNATKNRTKLQNEEVNAIFTLGCTQDFTLWFSFGSYIKGWVQLVHRIMLACKETLLGVLPVDEEENGERFKLKQKIMQCVGSMLVQNQTKAETQALYSWENWSSLLGEHTVTVCS